MVKVYFESKAHAELVAYFDSEEIYLACLPSLEKLAKKSRMFVTESIIDENTIDELVTIENEKFARKCSVTNEGMNEGWFSDEADKYFKYEKDALKCCIENGYKDIDEAYSDDFIYWTSWEDKEDYAYEMINGVLTEIL